MGRLGKWLLLVTLPVLMPTTARAWETVGMAGLTLAPRTAGAGYRMRPLVEHVDRTRSPPAEMLERLFAPPGGRDTPGHRHDAVLTVGGVEIRAEALRERMATGAGGRAMHAFDRLSAVGLQADWLVGEDDGLSLGVAGNMDKRAAPAILAGRRNIHGDGIVADCTWLHGSHLQMSLDWRADRSASRGGMDRLVELAQGAALDERGLRLTLSYLLSGAPRSPGMTFGIVARDARVAAVDFATSGFAKRQDLQTALFFRTAF